MPPSTALTGIVNIQAHKRLIVTPQRTADTRLTTPTPIIEPVIVCVVDTGIPKCSVIPKVAAPAVSAATPSSGVTFGLFVPIVCAVFQPPLAVQAAIAADQDIGTQAGIASESGITGPAIEAVAILPIAVWASFPPCAK